MPRLSYSHCDRLLEGEAFPIQIQHDFGDVTIPAYLARPGWFLYLNADGGGVHWERVNSETLFNVDSLRSLQNRPLTVGHTPKRITPSTWKELVEANFIVGTVNPRDRKDSSDPRLPILCHFSAQHGLDAIANRAEAEMSAKYTTELFPASDSPRDDSFVQVNRRYEEGAIMRRGEKGRHGAQAGLLTRKNFKLDQLRQDSANLKELGIDKLGFYYPLAYDTLDEASHYDMKPSPPAQPKGDNMKTVNLDQGQVSVEDLHVELVKDAHLKIQSLSKTRQIPIAGRQITVSDSHADELAAAVQELETQLKEAKTQAETLTATAATQKALIEEQQKKLKEAPSTTDGQITQLLKQRAAIASQAYPLLSQRQQGLTLDALVTCPTDEIKKAFVTAATNGVMKFDQSSTPEQIDTAYQGAYAVYANAYSTNTDAATQALPSTVQNPQSLLPSLAGSQQSGNGMNSLGSVFQNVVPVGSGGNPLLNSSGQRMTAQQQQEQVMKVQREQREQNYKKARGLA